MFNLIMRDSRRDDDPRQGLQRGDVGLVFVFYLIIPALIRFFARNCYIKRKLPSKKSILLITKFLQTS